MQISRSDNSLFLDNLINEFEKTAAIGIERISNGLVKEDPFEEHADGNVWFIKDGKLLKNKKKAI
jgi:hypothetical protein